MSNNAHVNDDEIEIHQLPEVSTLQAGMMVAVDSQPTGTKSFNLTTALEGKASASDFTTLENTVAEKANASDMTTALEGKVDAPSTTPAEGQVLTFDGSANTWANPPKGVYMLKYSEVTNLDDVDLDKATTIPTFILIDSKQTLVIGNGSSGTTITVNAGTIMRLEEVGVPDPDNAGKPKLLTFVSDYGNSATGGTYMTYGNYFVRLVVSKSMYGGVSKQFGVSADIWDSNLFRSQQIPVVKKYDNARGPAESIGNLNGDANSLIVSFEDAGSNKRRQLLPPAELASHDFSSDTTPEQIQFMGWGATSNRAGYKSCLVATHSDTATYPIQTPEVNFVRSVMGPSETEDNVICAVSVVTKPANGGNPTSFGGILIPRTRPGALQYWSDSNGSHLDFKSVNEVPASTSSDSGRVLTVDSNGTPIWSNGTPPVTLYHHWEKVNGDYNDNTEYLDFDVSSSGIKSAIVVIHMAMNAGKYVLFNVEGINMSDSAFGGTENYAHNNSDFNGIKPSVTNIMDYQYIGIKAIRIKHHGSQQHKFSTETNGIDIKVIGFK